MRIIPTFIYTSFFLLLPGSGNVHADNETLNHAPIVTLESDKLVQSGEQVSLNSTCVDIDGLILRTRWTQTAGAKIELDDIHSRNTGFTAPRVSEVRRVKFRLDVVDNRGASAFDFIEIFIRPTPEQSEEEKLETDKQVIDKVELKNEYDRSDSIITLGDYFDASLQYYIKRVHARYGEKYQTKFDSTASINLSAHIRPVDNLGISFSANPAHLTLHATKEAHFMPANYGIQAYYNWSSMYAYAGYGYARRERSTDDAVIGSEYSVSAVIGYRFKMPVLNSAPIPRFGNSIEFSSTMTNSTINDFSYIDADRYQNTLTFINPTLFYGTWLIRYGYLINVARHDFGSDYVYKGHQLSLLYHVQLYKRIMLSFKAKGMYLAYSNADSKIEFETGEERHRYQRHMQFQTKIVYRILKKLDVFGELEYMRVWSNLATALIYKGGAPVGYQDSSLGSSRVFGSRLGILFRF